MGRVSCPHPIGLRKYLPMQDGATATFDLFEPMGDHRTGGGLFQSFMDHLSRMENLYWHKTLFFNINIQKQKHPPQLRCGCLTFSMPRLTGWETLSFTAMTKERSAMGRKAVEWAHWKHESKFISPMLCYGPVLCTVSVLSGLSLSGRFWRLWAIDLFTLWFHFPFCRWFIMSVLLRTQIYRPWLLENSTIFTFG